MPTDWSVVDEEPEPKGYSVTPANDRKVWLLAAALVVAVLLLMKGANRV